MPATLTPSQAKIEALIRAHILALDNDASTAGYIGGGPGSVAHLYSALWLEGKDQFEQLETCYRLMSGARPKQYAHLRGRYYSVTLAARDVSRRGARWELGPHEAVVAVPSGHRLDVSVGSKKKGTVVERVTVETWPAWVRLEVVRKALDMILAVFLRARLEPCVPSSIWKVAVA